MPRAEFHARCYCGASTLAIDADPDIVAFCHCADCRRWTGAPAPAFVAFPDGAIDLTTLGPGASFTKGVQRWNCKKCGSPLVARFDYLPGQSYLPLGIIEEAGTLAPSLHCHADAQLPWLHIEDDLERINGSARATLSEAGE